MSKVLILSTPTRITDLSWEEFYDKISRDWPQKAARLRARRWRKLQERS